MTQGSTPWGRISAGLAQLAARLFRNQKAIGSSQSGSQTDLKPPADRSRAQRKGNLRFPERGAARTPDSVHDFRYSVLRIKLEWLHDGLISHVHGFKSHIRYAFAARWVVQPPCKRQGVSSNLAESFIAERTRHSAIMGCSSVWLGALHSGCRGRRFKSCHSKLINVFTGM